MSDALVGHMTEKVIIPPVEELKIINRKYTDKKPEDYLAYDYGEDLIPDFAKAGDGYRYHTTGLTHDKRGYPDMTFECQNELVPRLVNKIKNHIDDISLTEEYDLDGADVIIISYGITSRTILPAITKAKKKGIKVGYLRLKQYGLP